MKLLIIVPAFNEQDSIAATVGEISGAVPADVVVIDDGSRDGTAARAHAQGARVLRLPFNLGIGGAVQTGFRYAARHGYDIAVQMDGDGQHDPAFLDALLKPLQDGRADFSVGSRFIPPYLGYRSSFVRRIGIHFFAGLIGMLTRRSVTDPTSGFRACNRKAIAVFARQYPVDFPEPESLMLAHRFGLRVLEVPVQMRSRQFGHSSIRYLRTLYYMIKVTLAIVLQSIHRRKREMPDDR